MAAYRILHVVGTADLAGTATCRIVENLATRLNPEQYAVEVSFLRHGEFVERFRSRGIKTTSIGWSGSPAAPLGVARYASLLLSGKFDLIHLHTGGRFITSMSRSIGGAKIVRHVHGRATEETGSISTTIPLPKCDATIANSQIVADACGDSNAVVIYPGIDMDKFDPNEAPTQEQLVGTACRLEPVKGIPTLLKAIALVAKKHSSVRLVIAGEGSWRNRLEEEAAQLGVQDKVSFLGWQDDVATLLGSWSIFVLPSLDEGFGVAVLEAMASGLPVVASDVGGLRELVQDGQTGFLVPPNDVNQLADKLLFLLDDPDLRMRMGIAARSRAREAFSITEMVKKTTDVYERLLKPARNQKST
jgi:glycosyltransferase involved in cell wall biosynthesis